MAALRADFDCNRGEIWPPSIVAKDGVGGSIAIEFRSKFGHHHPRRALERCSRYAGGVLGRIFANWTVDHIARSTIDMQSHTSAHRGVTKEIKIVYIYTRN